jgi:hypothetical protein
MAVLFFSPPEIPRIKASPIIVSAQLCSRSRTSMAWVHTPVVSIVEDERNDCESVQMMVGEREDKKSIWVETGGGGDSHCTNSVMVSGGVDAGSRSRAENVMASRGVTVVSIESSCVT